ncbi:hypothetical protein [Ralstonia sp. ASV6]|uniref:hypothetical protein n=1 Tax=Ralstonia sp. ASV6 TaxID=2795124 RepID=UPI0018EAFD9D|nr:hypothetical protein [Ralstonia sp. ASV6]
MTYLIDGANTYAVLRGLCRRGLYPTEISLQVRSAVVAKEKAAGSLPAAQV